MKDRTAAAPTTEPLVAPRINTLSKALTRHAVRFARAEYGLSQSEWQVVTLLGVFEPVSIRDLAFHAMADAAQISRAAAALTERGFVARVRSARDNREAVLTLTAAGHRANKRLRAASLKRNETLLRDYDTGEIDALYAMLDTLIERARSFEEREGA